MVWDTVTKGIRWAGDIFGGGSSLPSSSPSNVGGLSFSDAMNLPAIGGYGSFSGGSLPSDVGNIPWTTAINAPNLGYSGFNWQDAIQGMINTTNPSNQGGSGSQRITTAEQTSPGKAAIGNSSFGSTIGDGYIDFGNRNPIVLPPIMAPDQSAGTRMADTESASGGGKNKLLSTALGAATGFAKGGPLGAVLGGFGGFLG